MGRDARVSVNCGPIRKGRRNRSGWRPKFCHYEGNASLHQTRLIKERTGTRGAKHSKAAGLWNRRLCIVAPTDAGGFRLFMASSGYRTGG